MPLDAEVALDLGQAGSDAARCFPIGIWGGHGESSWDGMGWGTEGMGSTVGSLGLQMSRAAPLPQFPPEAE